MLPPTELECLLEGLLSVPGSLYRAWKLENEPHGESGTEDAPGFSWFDWSQDSTMRLATVNQLKIITVMLARMAGDKKMKPTLLDPPGVESKPEEEHQHLDLARATARDMQAFLMGV